MTTEAADVEVIFFPVLFTGHWSFPNCCLPETSRNMLETSNEKAATCGTVRESQPKQGL